MRIVVDIGDDPRKGERAAVGGCEHVWTEAERRPFCMMCQTPKSDIDIIHDALNALLARAEKAEAENARLRDGTEGDMVPTAMLLGVEAELATLRGRVEKLYKTGFIAQLPFTGNKHSISWCEGFGAGRDAVKAAIKKDILDGRGVK